MIRGCRIKTWEETMHILIVEDDEAISNLLYQDLSDEGYDCRSAGTKYLV